MEEAKENAYSVPQTLHGISKQLGEMLGLWFCRKYGIQFAAFRYASVIGPGRRNGGASAYSSLIVQKPAQGEPYEVNVREEDAIPLAYIKDVTEVTTLAYEIIKKLKTRIYNVASLNPSPSSRKRLEKKFPGAKIKVVPQEKGKRIERLR